MNTDHEELLDLAEMLEKKAKVPATNVNAGYCIAKAAVCRRAAAIIAKKRKPVAKPCQIPTREQAAEYAGEIFLPKREAEKFCDHFSSNGWKVGGKTPMKDWKAALRNWRRSWEEKNPEQARNLRSSHAVGPGNPAGWEDFLSSKRIPLTSYDTARQYLKDEFRQWLSQPPQ